MTFTEIAQLITAAAAVGAVIMSARNGRKADLAQKAIQEVHLSINSRMDQLLEAARVAAHAAGMSEEKAKMAEVTLMVPEQTLKVTETPREK